MMKPSVMVNSFCRERETDGDGAQGDTGVQD